MASYTADMAIADHCAASDGLESVRVERVLTAGQIDKQYGGCGGLRRSRLWVGDTTSGFGGVDPVGYGKGLYKSRRFAAVGRRLGTGRVVEVDCLPTPSGANPRRS